MHSDPIARARRLGLEAGQRVATRLVKAGDRDPSRRRSVVADLEKEVRTRAALYARAGWTKAQGEAWAAGLIEASDPIIRAALDEWEAAYV